MPRRWFGAVSGLLDYLGSTRKELLRMVHKDSENKKSDKDPLWDDGIVFEISSESPQVDDSEARAASTDLDFQVPPPLKVPTISSEVSTANSEGAGCHD